MFELQIENLQFLVSQLHWYDILDILLVTSIVVSLYTYVRGTAAFRVLLGLGLVVVIYTWASAWGLFLTRAVMQGVVQVLIIFLIVIFAPEIRQVLERLNPLRIWRRPSPGNQQEYITEIVEAVQFLAAQKTGALIVIEREDRIDDIVRPGVPLAGDIRKETLVSFFHREVPTHDGAVWIRNARIHQVGVFLPISERDHDKKFGSRHRAALGISEVSDALVLVVSEERGVVSLVERGSIREIRNTDLLPDLIGARLAAQVVELSRLSWKEILLTGWKVKLTSLLLVSLAWIGLAGQQRVEEVYSVPIRTYGLPSGFQVQSMPVTEASLTLTGTRLALARLDSRSLSIPVDLSAAGPRTETLLIDPSDILVPPSVEIIRVDPQVLNIEISRTP